MFQQPQSQSSNHDKRPDQPASIPTPNSRMKWPPELLSTRILGEVKDESGRNYPRDLGRSIQLGGRTYYMFGDTFCFDDQGEFQGVTNNTISLVPDHKNPTKSRYLCSEAKVPEFVPFSHSERQFCEDPENKKENRRIVNWVFGGVVEIPHSDGREAWLFYDQVEICGAQPVRQNGVGVAKVHVSHRSGDITCKRVVPFPLFPSDGPLWGNISNISAPDGYTYLLTGVGSEYGLDNYMARIRTNVDFSDRQNYEFLHKHGVWKRTYTAPYGPFGELEHTVLSGQGQGAIVHVPKFTPPGRPYLWVGCEKFPTSQLCVGVAARPEGPWDVRMLGEMPKLDEHAKTRYCIYPHIWGSKLGRGEMLISWSDDGTMGGKVGIGVFCFALE
ncbi:hypothetical protein P280DRAFT_392857 [Massarina eburnea CBS 473.64]|uniref:DUF4185 domain-containing protein n=1 Tax=Massarina eburnea CBS 473.64 TaxID=1395130 RepID=A0A6A6SBG2_9PLEO|nr:hypothetical protein P280DRAFT_392857 [Massarina eburnea CBS 473.64]